MLEVSLFLVIVASLVQFSAEEDGTQNQSFLNAIAEIGDAAKKMMDAEMQKAYYTTLERIKSKVKRSHLDHSQMSAAYELLRFITKNLREGKIKVLHIKDFLKFAETDKLDKLLTTWDKLLLKKP